MSLTSSIAIRAQSALIDPLDVKLTNPTDTYDRTSSIAWASGTGASQCNQVFHTQYDIAGAGTQNIDLAGTVLSPLGQTVTLTKLKGMVFELVANGSATTASSILVGKGTSNGLVGPFVGTTPSVQIPGGGNFALTAPVDGWTVTAGTADTLTITNQDAAVIARVNVWLVGTQ